MADMGPLGPDDSALTPLRSFLKPLKLEQHRDVMNAAGYEDVDDFSTFSSDDVAVMRDALASKGVPPGHVQKIVKAIQSRMEYGTEPEVADSSFRQCDGAAEVHQIRPSSARNPRWMK